MADGVTVPEVLTAPPPARAKGLKRAKAADQPWHDKFIAALADAGVVRVACRQAGTSTELVYEYRESDPEFARRWQVALKDALDVVRAAAFRRAVEGWRRPACPACRGTRVASPAPGESAPCPACSGSGFDAAVERPSDGLAQFILSRLDPEFREARRLELAAAPGQAVSFAMMLRLTEADASPAAAELQAGPEPGEDDDAPPSAEPA